MTPATTKRDAVACAVLWLASVFALNLAWEIAHARFYAMWTEAQRVEIARFLLHCTLGDVAIAFAAFALAGLMLRRADWLVSRPWIGSAIVVIVTTAYTVWSEWYNVYQADNWAYAKNMPLIMGIGLTPLLQWLILPPLTTLICRVLWSRRPVRRNSPFFFRRTI